MRYLSLCSGIEAASVAWHPLGWEPFGFAEIEAFPSAVLAHHYPSVPNLGDMTKFKEWPDAAIDVLVGGTPCQSFSVAGLRKGLADPRGNLALTYLAILDRYRPSWCIWENVPGVLSSNGGRDFGAFLGGLGELGYSFAYRVLDAQFVRVDGFARAVPQRRRRVFVVGHLGDWRRPAAVLLEPEGLRWDSPPRREARERVAPTLSARPSGGGGLGTDFDLDGGLIAAPSISPALKARDFKGPSSDGDGDGAPLIACAVHDTLSVGANQTTGFLTEVVAHALRADDFDASEDGTGRGTPIVPVSVSPTLRAGGNKTGGDRPPGTDVDTSETLIPVSFRTSGNCGAWETGGTTDALTTGTDRTAHILAIPFDTTQITSAANFSSPKPGDACHPLAAGAHPPAVAFDMRGREGGSQFEGPHDTANNRAASGGSSRSYVAQTWAVRRLTPVECARLQGFPDDYLDIRFRGKPAADGPKYKALGNSMAVNVMRWIGQRIEMVEALSKEEAA
jgi:DNA (cytosine-5)-methyltransferase 1